MNNYGKLAAGVVGLAALGIVIAAGSGIFNNQAFTDGGVDVRNTACEDIAAARVAVNNEFETRKQQAQAQLDANRAKASDDYWTSNRQLEDAYHQCISAALTADPCKEPFEEIGRLYEEIMADFENGQGFNEAKFQEREQAKEKYNKCVEDASKPEFYQDQETECNKTLEAGRTANQQNRQAAEASAQTEYETALTEAENAKLQKQTILDAIEAKCKEPGGNTNLNVGAVTTGGTGTEIKSSSPACTGVFAGNDPELRKKLADLENQLNKAKAAGLRGGLFGIDHLQSAIDEARQALKDSERTCETDADCGDPTPVCCTGTQVGRLFCDGGVCANETTDCTDPEICAGKPAACVAPSTGVKQQDGVFISRTIPEVGSCSQNLQIVNLQQADADSVRYEIVGNIPSWVKIDKVGGSLPASVNITYSCNTVQGFGPGVYNANGSILVRNGAGELVNTIPLVITITVTPVAQELEVIEYNGKYLPVSQIHRFTGPECDGDEHWHANNGAVVATDGTTVPDASDCGYGKTKNVPVIRIPAVKVEVKGLEGLKTN